MSLLRKKWITILLLIALLAGLGCLGAYAAETEPTETPAPTGTPAPVEPTEGESPADGESEEQSGEPEMDGGPLTVVFQGENGTELGRQTVASGARLTSLPQDGGKTVAYWQRTSDKKVYTAEELLALPINSSWTFRNAGQRVRYYDSDAKTLLDTEYVKTGTAPKGPDGSGVTNWLDGNNKFVILSKQNITADTSYTAWYTPGLNTAHVAYINGVTDTTFCPNSYLTRSQAANILYNLLSDKSRGPFSVSFSDVKNTAWYAEAVYTLASHGIITGYEDGTFAPKGNISRGDFVLMISRLFALESGSCSYTDLKTTSYYYDAVAVASAKGWITGYEDGTFRGKNCITRAEAVTVINRVLGRVPDQTAIDALGHGIFTDLERTHWAFYQVMEAATDEGYVLKPIESLSKGLQTINGKMYFVDNTKTFVVYDQGVQEINGKKYYVPKKSAGIPIYSAGIHSFGSNGTGNILYLIQNDGSVRTKSDAGNDTPTFEYQHNMYCLHEDGRLYSNEWFTYQLDPGTKKPKANTGLYFGANGAYTSGNSSLDSVAYEFLSSRGLIQSTKSPRDRLLDTYIALRDYAIAYKRFANYSSWTIQECALNFLVHGKGSCAEFAMAMTYLAQRMGVDCQHEWGRIRNNASHSWELVYWSDGRTYLMDVEQEWGFMVGWYGSGKFDCFMIPWKEGVELNYGSRYGNATTNGWSPYRIDHTA